MTGSNRRHPACKAGALPAELIARFAGEHSMPDRGCQDTLLYFHGRSKNKPDKAGRLKID